MIGQTIQGKYVIVEKIGVGGMATVYKALQKNLDRYVALKIINEEISEEDELTKMFFQEAQDMGRLSHPNVVTVFDFGRDGDIFFIAMEYLEGQNLLKLIRHQGQQDQHTTIKYLAPIADALHHIHGMGLVHRDVKSSNIIITSKGRPVLMDFGIALHTDKTLMGKDEGLGTPEYMSPEQIKGQKLDHRTDIYSLGVVLYECMAGRVPFHGESVTSTISMVINNEPAPLKKSVKITPWLNSLILQMLAKDPAARAGSAREIFEIMEQELTTGTGKRTSGPRTRTKKTPVPGSGGRRRKRSGIIVLLLLLIILLLIPLGLWYAGFLDAGISGPAPAVTPAEPPPVEDVMAVAEKAEDHFNKGEYALAHRYYFRISELNADTAIYRKKYMESRIRLIAGLGGGIETRSFPGGTFTMGREGISGDNTPAHRVTLSPFELSVHEVTMEQYLAFLNAHDCNRRGYVGAVKVFLPEHEGLSGDSPLVSYTNDGFILNTAEKIPAFGVTWQGAIMFAKFLGGRLPTEAEWEFAAGAGDHDSREAFKENTAWYSGNATRPMPVGTREPNGNGMYDMLGNVWEWCGDYYGRDYYTTSPENDPAGPSSGSSRVIRGGDVRCSPSLLSGTYRAFLGEEVISGDFIGFRLCK